jgi:hypothetical protein
MHYPWNVAKASGMTDAFAAARTDAITAGCGGAWATPPASDVGDRRFEPCQPDLRKNNQRRINMREVTQATRYRALPNRRRLRLGLLLAAIRQSWRGDQAREIEITERLASQARRARRGGEYVPMVRNGRRYC